MAIFLYVFIPFAVAGLFQYGLTLLVPKEAAPAKDGERDKFSKPARKSYDESRIVDQGSSRSSTDDDTPGSIVAREKARKLERVEPKAVAAEPEEFQLPPDFDIAEFRSARD